MISETFLCSFFSWTKSLQGASLVAQTVKNLPVMQETQVQSLDQEDPLEEEMATHSSVLAWRIHGQRSLVGYSPWNSPGKNRGVGSHFFLQGIFLIQGLNLGLLHCRQILY